MKTKKICRALMLIALTATTNQFKVAAQNWVTTGATGTYVSPSEYSVLGTDGSTASGQQDVQFYSGGTEFMRLKNTGLFGIGLTSPAHLLDVYGGDVNVGSSTNATGYMIGGNYVV